MNTLLKLTIFTSIVTFMGCSSDVPLAEIDLQSATTEELSEHYEALNDQLTDVIEDKDYYYKKLIKSKNEYRIISNRIKNRTSRLQAVQALAAKEEGIAQSEYADQIASHEEKLSEYYQDIAEVQKDISEYTSLTKELTAKSLDLRVYRNKVYDAYIHSRNKLKEGDEKAALSKEPKDGS